MRRGHPAGKSDALWLGLKGGMTPSGVRQVVQRRAVEARLGHLHPPLRSPV